MNESIIPTNEFQTQITRELLDNYSSEVQEQFLDFIDNVPYIKWMIGERPRAKDLPRDKFGRIIVDIAHPHILENVEYFMPAIRFYKENGCYSLLKPNRNPNSEYGKWFYEEVRRCREGYVRESDGEWVTGQMYWFLNYSPIMITYVSEKTGKEYRIEGFPAFWDGIYLRFHYIEQARAAGLQAMELAKRGCGKSFTIASMMSHNLILGEDSEATRRVTTILTAYTKEYLGKKDGTFSKFTPMVDFCAKNTEFPRLMLTRRASDMLWQMGYKNTNGNEEGSLNIVMGVAVKDDIGKVRGNRGTIFFEEMGNFPKFKDVWNNVRDSVKRGNKAFALLYAVGTAGDKESDFSSVRDMLFNPQAFDIYATKNVYSKKGKGINEFAYFFPAFLCYNDECICKDGNSDVVKALLEILTEREKVKSDPATLLSVTAQQPIVPEEAILRVRSKFFPTVMLNERLHQLDTNPRVYDDVYIGELFEAAGGVQFRATDDVPIREYGGDIVAEGALEIYTMPQNGTIPSNRYCIGVDPVDNDKAESNSLMSVIVFDMFNDEIVAEYTGRKQYAEDGYEIVRLLGLFYNAKIMYESNRKMMYAYFSKKRSLWMLAECPEWIKAKGLAKYDMFGSSKIGVSVNAALISTGIELINDWLKKPTAVNYRDENGEEHIDEAPQLFKIRNRALLQELVSYSPEKNTDRVSAMFQVMFYREEFIIKYGGAGADIEGEKDDADDEFFNLDWNNYFSRRRNNPFVDTNFGGTSD